MKSEGTLSTASPQKSLICVLKMRTAMPLVNPAVTGYGMNLIIVPKRASPMTKSMTPGHDRADGQIFSAILGINAIEDDDERAGRPANGNLRAAQAGDQNPGNHRRENARLRRHA